MLMWVLIGATVLTYGVNIRLYYYFKKHPKQPGETLATILGVNMTVLLTDGVFLFIGKLLEDAVLVIE